MPPAESYVTPHTKELFLPEFATQDADIYSVLFKTWQSFAQRSILWIEAAPQATDLTATVGFWGQ